MTCSTSKAMERGAPQSVTSVPENVHRHTVGMLSVALSVDSVVVAQWHAVGEAEVVTVLIVAVVSHIVISSVEVGDRAVTVVVYPRNVDVSVTVVVIISVREGRRAVTVVVA